MSYVVKRSGAPRNRFANEGLRIRFSGLCNNLCQTRGAKALLIVALVTVGLTPRSGGAQATAAPVMTVRHTISARVGTVTKAVLGAPRRAFAADMSGVAALNSNVHSANAWAATASVSSNVPGTLIIESAALAGGMATTGEAGGGSSTNATAWRVVNAEGQLVPWSGEPVAVSAPFRAGRHEVLILLVAPDGEAVPPVANVRVSPI